jgi:hypothetical protein
MVMAMMVETEALRLCLRFIDLAEAEAEPAQQPVAARVVQAIAARFLALYKIIV